MTRSTAARKQGTRDENWRARISAQERSGISVKQFCREHDLTEQSFYYWRKRLQTPALMRFALVETEPRSGTADHAALELLLATGERLRISSGVDAGTLRQVLEALRA
jgi:transposase-like protein